MDEKELSSVDLERPNELAATGPRSILRIIGLLEIFAGSDEGATLAELSGKLMTPKSSLLMLLRPLVAAGYLTRSQGRFSPGPFIFRLASTALNERRFHLSLRPYLEELARRTKESVYVAVIDAEMRVATFIDMVSSVHSVRNTMPIGFVRPLYATAAGRILLAYQPPEWIDTYLREAEIKPLTTETKLGRDEIAAELEKIRQTGSAIVIDESTGGGSAFACPVLAPDGKVEAALTVAAPTSRLLPNLIAVKLATLEVTALASGLIRRRDDCFANQADSA